MAHLSCVGETREGLASILDRFADAGIENVLALRGDPPRGEDGVRPARGRALAAPPSWPSSSAHGYRLHDRRRLLSRGPPRGREPGGRPRLPEDEGRRRRGLPDHPALLRQPRLLRLRRRRRASAGSRCRSSPASCRSPASARWRGSAPLCDATIPDELTRGDGGARRRRGGRARCSGSPTPPASARSCSRRGAPGIHFYALNRAPGTRAVLAALRAARPWERAPAESDAEPRRLRLARRWTLERSFRLPRPPDRLRRVRRGRPRARPRPTAC